MNVSIISRINSGLRDIVSLVYPNLCLCCLEELVEEKSSYFCVACHAQFPFTNDINLIENELMYHFYGRVPIARATAMMWYSEGGIVQQLIHNMKYRQMSEIATQLGIMLGKKIADSQFGIGIELCIPVPMHPKKIKIRGFNQAGLIADAVAEETSIKSDHNILIKSKETITQTSKNRKERQSNSTENYSVMHNERFVGKHVLLIDDVVTTGSTLEACANNLIKHGAGKVSVACLAKGNRFL